MHVIYEKSDSDQPVNSHIQTHAIGIHYLDRIISKRLGLILVCCSWAFQFESTYQPERFARGGPTLTTLSFLWRGEDP